MKSIEEILSDIASYAQYNEKVLSDSIDVKFTLANMQEIVTKYAWQVEELADYLAADTVYDTCKNIWDFARKYICFKLEKGEVLQTPAMTIATEEGDCDCVSILTGCILFNLGLENDSFFRVVAHLAKHPDEFTHVFTVVEDGTEEIYIDFVPEITHFNAKNIHFFKQQDYAIMSKTVMLTH